MHTNRFLRSLSPSRFQVHIGDRVAAILDVTGVIVNIYILADEVRLLATCADTAVGTAERIAAGEFDNDFRFEITPWDEPEIGCTHTVTMIATPSQIVQERFTTDDPYGNVEAARETQAIPFEERMVMYAERGW